MTPEALFTLANQLALPGWLLLLAGLFAQRRDGGTASRARRLRTRV